jgi:hypothetical protein
VSDHDIILFGIIRLIYRNFSKPSLETSKSTKKRSKKATLFDDKYEVPMLKKQETIRKRHRDEREEEDESMKSSKEQVKIIFRDLKLIIIFRMTMCLGNYSRERLASIRHFSMTK